MHKGGGSYFTSNLPPKGLKMTLRVFSLKIIFQNLTPIFRFRGIPATPQFFFSRIFFLKIIKLRHFLTDFALTRLKMTGKLNPRKRWK